MQISVVDPIFQTKLVIALLALAVVLTTKKKQVGSALDTN